MLQIAFINLCEKRFDSCEWERDSMKRLPKRCWRRSDANSPSSFRLSCTIIKRIWQMLTQTIGWTYWSTSSTCCSFSIYAANKTILNHTRFTLSAHINSVLTSSTKSNAACAINWFKCRWSSFCQRMKRKPMKFLYGNWSGSSLTYLNLFAAGEFHFEYWIIEVAHDGEIIATCHISRILQVNNDISSILDGVFRRFVLMSQIFTFFDVLRQILLIRMQKHESSAPCHKCCYGCHRYYVLVNDFKNWYCLCDCNCWRTRMLNAEGK